MVVGNRCTLGYSTKEDSLTDLILSAGFLAFAAQSGFLQAVEECGLDVGGVCGTSSGALVGALWSAGMPAERIYTELCGQQPIGFVRPHMRIWKGMFTLDAVVARLRRDLPATFDELERPFGVGVVDAGRPRLVTRGDLPAAVAASCAIPYLFTPIIFDGRRLSDGGELDRTFFRAWRGHRPSSEVTMHLVDRSMGAACNDDLSTIEVVRSAASGAQFWNLGDTRSRFEASYQRAHAVFSERAEDSEISRA